MRNKDIKLFFATHEHVSLVGPVFDVYNFFIHESRDEDVDCYLYVTLLAAFYVSVTTFGMPSFSREPLS